MRADRVIRARVRSRFLITMGDEKTWDGVLFDADDNTLVLRDASAVQADGSRVPVDLELFLPRIDVAYMQRLT